ncbi:MAG: 30S ribosome-binding factor RbfA [Clostridia bacterium]|nr:30S ribosome-binding factor RbfA [Clostridia bacterium]
MQVKRADRLSQEIQRALADILKSELHDPRVGEMASIVRVDLTGDLQIAKVYVSVYGDDETQTQTFAGLEAAKGFIKRQLSDRVKVRKMPELVFVKDDSIAYSVHISELLNQIKEEKR